MTLIDWTIIFYYGLGVVLMFILLSLGDAWQYEAQREAPWNVLRSCIWPFMLVVGCATAFSWVADKLMNKLRIKIGK